MSNQAMRHQPRRSSNGRMRAILAEFPKLRPDLRHDPSELRDARLRFCERTLEMKEGSLKTMSRLNWNQLGVVLDEIREKRKNSGPSAGAPIHSKATKQSPGLVAISADRGGVSCGPGIESQATGSGEIIHLAGNEQTWAIERVFEYLEWAPERRRHYIASRFGTKSEKMLKPDKAAALLYQLFLIAAHRDLKLRLGNDVPVSRDQEKAEIPAIKRRLGIDQRS